MSTADEVLTVRRDGVTVEKSFEPDEFPVPAIAFAITSDRDEPVTLRMYDVLPDDVQANNVGFHPEYGEEFWSVEDGRIVFEREFDPDEEYTTVYAVRDSDLDTVERFLVDPEIDAVDPPQNPIGDNSQVVRDVISGGGSVPGLDDDADAEGEGDEADAEADVDVDVDTDSDTDSDAEPATAESGPEGDDIEPLQLKDPNASGEEGATAPPGAGSSVGPGPDFDPDPEEPTGDAGETSTEADSDTGAGSGAATEYASGSVAATLAAELSEDAVDDDTKAQLRDALGVSGGDGSTDARIKRLQTEFADLRAYADALQEFIDENGEAQQLLREFREEVESFESQLEAVDERSEETADAVQSMNGRIGQMSGRLNEVAEDVSAVESSLERVNADIAAVESSVEEDVAEVGEDVAAVAEEVEAVEASVEDVDDRVETIADDLAGVRTRVADLEDESVTEEEFDAMRDRVADVENDLDGVDDLDARLSAIEGDIGSLQDDIDDLAEFRQRVQAVFGGGGGMGGAGGGGGGDGEESADGGDADDADGGED